MTARKSPARGDRKGVRHPRLRNAQHGQSIWNLMTLYGSYGTIVRGQYDAYHAADCPCCIEHERAKIKRSVENAAPVLRDPECVFDVQCWCKRTIVKVSASDLSRGLTGSCGSRHCDIIERQRRERHDHDPN